MSDTYSHPKPGERVTVHFHDGKWNGQDLEFVTRDVVATMVGNSLCATLQKELRERFQVSECDRMRDSLMRVQKPSVPPPSGSCYSVLFCDDGEELQYVACEIIPVFWQRGESSNEVHRALSEHAARHGLSGSKASCSRLHDGMVVVSTCPRK